MTTLNKKIKIVLIGAGSVVFGLNSLKDAFSSKELWGNKLVFVDIDESAAKNIAEAAMRINKELNAGYEISYTTDRKKALPNSDFVITSVAVNRMEMWKQDFEIPRKHGINHVLGENQGPGALFHTMRNIPIMLEICRDIEKYAPNALLLNFTNPESRLCIAINKYTNVKVVGLCHQIEEGKRIVSEIMNKSPEEIEFKAWGLNHFTWVHDMRDKITGQDLYPLFREKELNFDPEFEKLSRFIFHKFGLFPTSGDEHLGEFFPYAHEMISTQGYDFIGYNQKQKKMRETISKIKNESIPFDASIISPSGERAFDIIKGITFNTNEVIESANLPNRGYITNLPSDAIVEVPALVSGKGVQGIGLGELDRGIAALCSNQVHVQHLAVDAGFYGNSELALQALLVDPNVPSQNAAINLFDDLMERNKDYLPQFH